MDRTRKGINAYQSVVKGSQKKDQANQTARVQQISFPQLKPKKDQKGKKRQGLTDEQLALALLQGDQAAVPSSIDRNKSNDTGNRNTAKGTPPNNHSQKEPIPERGLIKTVKEGNKAKRVAKFLLLIGKEEAAKVLRHLPEDQVESILKEVTLIRRIEKTEAQHILDEFGYLTNRYSGDFGGVEAARHILTAAFGSDKADAVLKKAVPEEKKVPFQFVNELDHQQVLILLKDESFQAISVILPYLKPDLAGQVLRELPEDVRLNVVRRMARAEKIPPEIISGVERVLRDRIRRQGKMDGDRIDGEAALAEILKNMDFVGGERLLEDLEDDSPEMARSLKEKLFTVDILFRIPDTQLQKVLRDYSEQEIAVILKGKTEDVRNRIFLNISERRRYFITEESAHLGAMRRSEVDQATREFLSFIRRQVQEGNIQILKEKEEYV